MSGICNNCKQKVNSGLMVNYSIYKKSIGYWCNKKECRKVYIKTK